MPTNHDPEQVRISLVRFLDDYQLYFDAIRDRSTARAELRPDLQRQEALASSLLTEILGYRGLQSGGFMPVNFGSISETITSSLLGGNNAMLRNFAPLGDAVTGWLNQAIGKIDAGLWPSEEVDPPRLAIRSESLRERCADLLAAPGNFDRVIREATIVLESTVRSAVPHSVLTARIPTSGDQSGNNLFNALLKPGDAAIEISADRRKQAAFRAMCLGISQYVRNDYHHHIEDQTKWGWAWAVVGLVDQLISAVETATIQQTASSEPESCWPPEDGVDESAATF